MKRAIEVAALLGCLAVLLVFGWSSQGSAPSTYSSYDGGTNGYEALYNVLTNEGVETRHLTEPLGLMSRDVRVYVATPVLGLGGGLDSGGVQSLLKRHVRVVVFALKGDVVPKGAVRLDARLFTNLALDMQPANALRAYEAIAGYGPVAFDEHLHGYDTDASMWSVLPQNVRVAFFMVIAALVLALIGLNIRHRPAIVREPPQERDSSAYIASMARLLQRAGAPHVALPRKDQP